MKLDDAQSGFTVGCTDENAANEIASACNLKPLTARVLVARGIDTPQAVRAFLSPTLERDWHDPACIPGMTQVADAVQAAIEAGKRILVFGDFDVDGITATTISVRGLRALGAQVQGLIPHRYDEGYALSPAAVKRGMAFEPDLIMTVDCGISCADEVNAIRGLGIEVCITDHHEPGDLVPQGVPLADPKITEGCPSRNLAGAGVALKLICMLGARMGKPDLWRDLTDFAALGTIADLMPLVGENRALVADGISHIRNNPRWGFTALATVCGVDPSDITSTKLSFSLIPRMNAAGRMGDATVAYDLLMCDEQEQAQLLASKLEQANNLRRETESELSKAVEDRLKQGFADEEVIVVAGKGWHEGVKGIVASRIARAYKRPAIIFSIEGDEARGSGRTYGDLNLFELASGCSDLFKKFGGHAAAVGITLPADKLGEFQRRICAQVAEAMREAPAAGIHVDAVADVEECTVQDFDELEMLQPFGNTNPVPLLALHSVFLENRSSVGKLGNHFRYNASDGVSQVPGIFFGPDHIDELIACASSCDVVFEPSVDEWRGRRTAKLMTRDIKVQQFPVPDLEQPQGAMAQRMEELFELQSEICEVGEYAGITRAARFNTKVVGVTFENRQSVLSTLEEGTELCLNRMPDNEYDSNAIAVAMPDGTQLGFLNKHLARRIAPVMDEGVVYDAAVSSVTGGPADTCEQGRSRALGPLGVRDPGVVDRNYGVNILVRRVDLDLLCSEEDEQPKADTLAASREAWSSLSPDNLDDALRVALIGEHELHDAQVQALESLAAHRNTLVVMATGRGKSLIFHLHAARLALKDAKASIFVYPLRALVADQAFHLQETFEQFGLSVHVLTGESDDAVRAGVFGGLADGTVDCILTTPEFLSIHANSFARSGRAGFVVVDEAHHVAQARAGNRPAYAGLDTTLAALGNPLVLAVTATAGDAQARVIQDTLSIDKLILDATVRENLHIDDRRDIRTREQYLANIVAKGGKCVIYVNSRDQSVALTRMLRHRLPSMAPLIGFYNAGLSKPDRKAIEDAFRRGELMTIVSTSAFGEGIDIPDIEHVVLYHLPFNDIEFNQMSGRAGRDGRDATIHLLFGYNDARINERILQAGAPARASLAVLYRVLKDLAKQAEQRGEDGFSCTNNELADRAKRLDKNAKLEESSVSCGISVFRELGFVETSGASVARYIRLVPNPGKMDLEDSVRYREGLEELQNFDEFRVWALKANAHDLLDRFNRPILPSGI
jgi:single-stranded-DNA-specific exonuclease